MPSRDSCRFRNCEGYQIARQPFFNTSLRTVCFDLAVSDITLFWLGIATAAEQDPASLQRRKAALEVQKLELEVAKLTKDDGELRNWLTGIFGLLAGIGGTVAMVWVARRTRFGTLDQSVHDERLKLYPGLVKACARLALYFPISDPS
ncbi:MAG TPA: hypothetical protein VFN94_11440, partial [Nitrospiria bacterium]|nr:hypothetical protein [Nitrospiria bacterium]